MRISIGERGGAPDHVPASAASERGNGKKTSTLKRRKKRQKPILTSRSQARYWNDEGFFLATQSATARRVP